VPKKNSLANSHVRDIYENMFISNLKKITFASAIVVSFSFAAFAQSTIFNAPSTDVVAPKSFYLEADFVTHPNRESNGGFQSYGLRGVYGVRRNLEIGANVFVSKLSADLPAEFQPNVKWQVYSNEEKGVAVSGGATAFVPMNKAAGNRTYAMVYSNVSKKVKQANGMRLTGGVYTVVGTKSGFGTKSGAIVGFEQPISKRVNFVADWFSGKNRFGYSAAGMSVVVTSRQTLYVGYNFGNSGRGNNSLAIFYSRTF
jgi:hypothetical protein